MVWTTTGETDLDFDLRPIFLGDLDFFLLGCGERDFERCLRVKERDLERLLDLSGDRFRFAGDRERLRTGDRVFDRLREGGVLDLVLLRGLLVLERRLRLCMTSDRDRVRLLLRTDRERDRRDLGGGDLLRRDTDRLLERLPPPRLPSDRDLERRAGRRDLDRDRRFLVREPERRLAAPDLLGDRVLERLVPPRDRDSDLRLLLGDRDRERDLRERFGDRDTFLLGDGELLRLKGDFDFFGDLDFFFFGVKERDADRDRWPTLLGDLRDGESDFLTDFGD